MAACQVCGNGAPAGAAYCPACGHRLGGAVPSPIVVEVHNPPPEPGPAQSCFNGCIGCFSWLVVAVLVLLVISWIISC